LKAKNSKKPEQLMRQYCEGYKNRDLPHLLSLFSNQVNMWGTGPDEYRVGLKEMEAQLKRELSQSEAGEINIVSFLPTPENALWAAAVCNATITVEGKDHQLTNLRWTIAIDQEDGAWKISHLHASFPDLRNPEGSPFPIGNKESETHLWL